jgi:signal transduction histidine kinase/PAS domain-containing protein
MTTQCMVAPISSSLWFVIVGLVVAAGGTLVLAAFAIRHDDGDPTIRSFTVLLAMLFIWTAGEGGRLLAPTPGGKLIWQYVLYIGAVGVPVAWLLFSLLYTGRTRYVRRATVGALLHVAIVNLVALYTNRFHHLFYETTGLTYIGATPIFQSSAGPLWWLNAGYSYLLVALRILLLVRFAVTAENLYRTQTAAFVVGALVPLGANAIFVFGFVFDPVIDFTPLAFALSSLLLFVAIFYGRFIDFVPVAQEAVVRAVEDGILVVEDGQIISANPEAASMLTDAGDVDALVGRDFATLEPTLSVRAEDTQSSTEPGVSRGFEAESGSDGDDQWFWVRWVDLSTTRARGGSVVTLTDITEKKRLERQLRGIQRTHQQLIVAEDEAQIVAVAVEAASEVLGLPITGVWKYDEEDSLLEPWGMTDEATDLLDDQPTFEPGDSLAWKAFANEELQTYCDVGEHGDVHNPETPLDAELLAPIGNWGVMVSGSTTPTEFEDVDFDLVRVLAAAVESALERTEREREVRRRERELSRQNERLKEFTNVISHDLRSPLNNASIYLDMLRSDLEDDRIASAADANQRAREMLDDLLALARQGKTVTDGDTQPLETTVSRAWQSVHSQEATLAIDDDLGSVDADHSRLREVFENLFRNAVDHGGDSVRVRVGRLDDRPGIHVTDDGPGVPEDVRDEVFDHGYTTDRSGTGFGLAIVRRIVEAHGWTVAATASVDGGARFEIDGMQSLSDAPLSPAED